MDNKNLQITNHDFLIYKDSSNNVKVSVMLINNDLWKTFIWSNKKGGSNEENQR